MISIFKKSSPVNGHIKINVKLTFVCCFIVLLNICVVDIPLFAMVVAVFEFVILMYLTLTANIGGFVLCSLVFVSTAFDSVGFVTSNSTFELYSVMHVPFSRGFLFFYILHFLQVLIIFFKDPTLGWLKVLKARCRDVYIVCMFIIVAQLSGLISGLVSIFTSDGRLYEWLFLYFTKEFFLLSSFNLTIIYVSYSIAVFPDFIDKLKQTLYSIFVSMIICSMHFTISGKTGNYDGTPVLLMPLAYFFNSVVVLFLLFKQYSNKLLLLVFTCLSFYVQFVASSPLAGKSWLVFILLPVIMLIIALRQKRLLLAAISSVTFTLALFVFFQTAELSYHAQNKLDQSVSLLRFFVIDVFANNSLYHSIAASPKFRIEEFLNIMYEYAEKPWFALFGKGFGGGVSDYRQSLGMFVSGGFSDDQYMHGLFIVLHSSFNVIFLKYGFYGLIMLVFTLLKCFLNCHVSPWLAIGGLWLAMFYGFSHSVAFLAIPALILGLYEIRPRVKI